MTYNNDKIVRDESIDILRFIGISLIILVHCGAPNWLAQLRCFDVPLMFFVSGLAFSGRAITHLNYKDYVVKRAKRLLIPTWSFLFVFFIIYVGALWVYCKKLPPSIYFIESFTMTGGIGYVWIMRVFLLVALVVPFLIYINNSIQSNKLFVINIFLYLLGVEFLIRLNSYFIGVPILSRFVEEWFINTVSYSILFLLGLKMRFLDSKRCLNFTVIFMLMFVASMITYYYNNGLPIIISPIYKYPPHSYYILYGIFVCSSFWTIREYLKILNCKLIRFIGQNTVWIYLYHIPLVWLPIDLNWALRYVIVYAVSILFFMFQYAIYIKLKDKYGVVKYLVG